MSWLVSDARVLASVERAESRSQRRRGLLGRESLDGAFVISPCRWVHTLGMKFAIDVAFVDADDIVVRTVRMPPHRLGRPVRRAEFVIEATAGSFERWGLAPGDHVEVRLDGGDADGSDAGSRPGQRSRRAQRSHRSQRSLTPATHLVVAEAS